MTPLGWYVFPFAMILNLLLTLRACNWIVWIARVDRDADAAAGRELATNDSLPRAARAKQIFQNAIDDLFVEASRISVRREIELQRFALDAKCVGNIFDCYTREVRLPCDWAHGGKFWTLKPDRITAARVLIPKGFQRLC